MAKFLRVILWLVKITIASLAALFLLLFILFRYADYRDGLVEQEWAHFVERLQAAANVENERELIENLQRFDAELTDWRFRAPTNICSTGPEDNCLTECREPEHANTARCRGAYRKANLFFKALRCGRSVYVFWTVENDGTLTDVAGERTDCLAALNTNPRHMRFDIW